METTSKTCHINVWNELGWKLDTDMLNAVLKRIAYEAPCAKIIDIYPQERVPADAPAWKHPGWLEWRIRIHYYSGSEMTIGVIQRSIDAEYEFCS